MKPGKYDILKELIERKKNVILQGAPGVGKTFVAEKLAYSIIGSNDSSKIKLVQFHQNYTYEDFIMGFRPSQNGFELKTGIFYEFCKKAENDGENKYFFIIDEINRGNLSKIFGELFMLIENDKRGKKVPLLYKNEDFSIPKNLYIIGTMNTADRSLAMIDYALRRRFSFFEIEPAFDFEKFTNENLTTQTFRNLIGKIKELNDEISKDESLGKGFRIGHSYFLSNKDENNKDEKNIFVSDQELKLIVDYDIIPMLEEYWFDEPDKVENGKKNFVVNLNEKIRKCFHKKYLLYDFLRI